MNFLNEEEFKTLIDEYYQQGIKVLYNIIEIEEYVSIRLIFIIAHLTSVWFSKELFSSLGNWLFQEIYLVGAIQFLGGTVFIALAILTQKHMPYHQLQVLTASWLFVKGVYRILVYFPKIHIFYYILVCGFVSGISYLGIHALKKWVPKLNLKKKED